MIERRIRSRFRRGGGEAAFMLGEGVGVERVLARQVLRMNESLGAGDPRSKLRRRFARFALAVIGVAGRGEISLRQLGPLRPLASRDARAEPDAVSAWRRAEYSRRTRASRPASGLSSALSSSAATARTAAAKNAIWLGKTSRNRPEMRNVTSTRGRPSMASGNTSKPLTRVDAASQVGRQPMSANACARSSPPVRMVAEPQRSRTMRFGHSP